MSSINSFTLADADLKFVIVAFNSKILDFKLCLLLGSKTSVKPVIKESALLITLTLTAQSWTFSKGGNAFDGTYKTSSVVGKGTEYPYKTPILVINKFDNPNIGDFVLGFKSNSRMWKFTA